MFSGATLAGWDAILKGGVGEGLPLEIVDAFLSAGFEGDRHGTRVDMIEAASDALS